jgi:hypothetical protein
MDQRWDPCPECGDTRVTIGATLAVTATAAVSFHATFLQKLAEARPTPDEFAAVVTALQLPESALGPEEARRAIQDAVPRLAATAAELSKVPVVQWAGFLGYALPVLLPLLHAGFTREALGESLVLLGSASLIAAGKGEAKAGPL